VPPRAARALGSYFQRPGYDLESQDVSDDLYGKFILADYMSRTLGSRKDAIRKTFEAIRSEGFGGSAKSAINDVVTSGGSSLATLFDGFARSNWEQDYTTSWSSWLTDPSVAGDDLGPARPARERRDFANNETKGGSVWIGQGATHYVELVPPLGGSGLFNISVSGIYGAGVDVQLVTYSNYSAPALPTVCSTATFTLTDTDTQVLSAEVAPGCRYVAMMFTENSFSGDPFREFGWDATYVPAALHDSFNRPDRADGTGWGTADSGQTWIGNDFAMQQTGIDVPFNNGGIAAGQGYIDIPGATDTTPSAVASIRSPKFGNCDYLVLGHFGDVSGPHNSPNLTHVALYAGWDENSVNLDGQFGTGNPSPTGWTSIDATQPFYVRMHLDSTAGVIAEKVWSASSPEPKAWTLWWVVGPYRSVPWPFEIQAGDAAGTADFARFYFDQIDVWAAP
jgi:hypothetical protein